MDLLLVSARNSGTAHIIQALNSHQKISIEQRSSLTEAGRYLEQQPVAAIVLVADQATSQRLVSLDSYRHGRPYIVFAEKHATAYLGDLANLPYVDVLSADMASLPTLPDLLQHLLARYPGRTGKTLSPRPGTRPLYDLNLADSLREAAGALAPPLDSDKVLDRLLETLLTLVKCDAADVQLVLGDQARIVREYGYEQRDTQTGAPMRYSLNETRNLRMAALTGHPVLIEDTEVYEGWVSQPGTEWIRSHLSMPIISNNALLGFLNAASRTPGVFSIHDGEMLAAFAPIAAMAMQNARLFQSKQEQIVSLESLNQVGLQTANEKDPLIIGRTVVQSALSLTHSDGAAFFRYNPENQLLEQHESAGIIADHENFNIALGSGASGRAWMQQKPVIVNDYSLWRDHVDYPDADAVRALAVVPVTWQERNFGVLTVYHQAAQYHYAQHELHILQLLAQHMAVAIFGAEIYQTLAYERDQLQALAEIDKQILSISDTSERAVELVLEYALSLIKTNKGIIAVASQGVEPVMFFSRGLDDAQAAKTLMIANWEKDAAFHNERGPDGYLAFNHNHHRNSKFTEWSNSENIVSGLSIPLWLHGRFVGKLMLFSSQAHIWSEDEVRIGKMLASQAAIAVDKALLSQRLQRRLEEAETLNKVLQAASTTLETERILQQICEEVQRILKVPLVSASLLQKGHLTLVAESRDVFYPDMKRPAVNLAETLALQQAFEARYPLSFRKVHEDAPKLGKLLCRSLTTSLLFVPLTLRDTPVGVLYAESPVERNFTQAEIRLVQLIATAITPTLDNANLFQEVQDSQKRVEVAYAQLQRLDSLKSQFIQNVTHELRTPLAIVKGYVDLLMDDALGEPIQGGAMDQAMGAIQTHTNNLVTLVESITTLEDMKVGKLDLHTQMVQPLCQAAIQSCWQKALRQKVEIVSDFSPHLPELNLDAENILRALNQILDNAIKFNRKQGRIWVRTRQQNNEVWIEVQDEGIGIPKPELDRIFDRFYQVNGATTRRYGGMGLGLSLVKDVVSGHEGRVWAHSDGNENGTTITIALPVPETVLK